MIVGAAIGAASSIAGAIMGHKQAKKQKQALENQRISNEAWYNRRMNEDATQRADAQRVLQKTEDAIRERNKSAAGAQSVMGGTEESLSATKAANASAMADAASQIAAAGANRKDAIESQYMERRDNIANKQMDIQNQEASNFANAVKGVGSAVGSLVEAGIGSGADKGSSEESGDKEDDKNKTKQ